MSYHGHGYLNQCCHAESEDFLATLLWCALIENITGLILAILGQPHAVAMFQSYQVSVWLVYGGI